MHFKHTLCVPASLQNWVLHNVIDMCTNEIQDSACAMCLLLLGEHHEFDWSEMFIASLLLMSSMVIGAGARWFRTSRLVSHASPYLRHCYIVQS